MKQLDTEEFREKYKFYLKELIAFFDRYDIQYSLAYGTLLGAYRDGDMIEWDSDVDLFITKDSERKIKDNEGNLPNCFRFDCYSDGKTFFMLDRIVIKNLFRKNESKQRECWIDLFVIEPMDNTKKNINIWKKIDKKLKLSDFKYRSKGKNLLKTIIRCFIGLFVQNRKTINAKCRRLHKKITNMNSECFGGLYEICGATFCCECIDIQFGHDKYKCFKNSREILIHLYGTDFMIPKKYNAPIESFYILEE